MKRLMIVGISVLALVACGNSENGSGAAVPESSAAPGQQSVTASPGSTLPPVAEVQSPAAPSGQVPTVDAGGDAGPAQPAVCLETDSPAVTDAVASLPQYFDGVPWVVYDSGDQCASFTWVAATSEGATASTPDQYLFFANGRYLGTPTSAPYSFTFVSGQTPDTITIGYRWLIGDDAFASPSGGPALIRYQWDGSQVTMLDSLPPEVVPA